MSKYKHLNLISKNQIEIEWAVYRISIFYSLQVEKFSDVLSIIILKCSKIYVIACVFAVKIHWKFKVAVIFIEMLLYHLSYMILWKIRK